MVFWDSVFNVINFLFALLSLATIILGAYILIKGPIKYQPPPLVEPTPARLMGGVAIIGGLEMLFRSAYFLFTGKLFWYGLPGYCKRLSSVFYDHGQCNYFGTAVPRHKLRPQNSI